MNQVTLLLNEQPRWFDWWLWLDGLVAGWHGWQNHRCGVDDKWGCLRADRRKRSVLATCGSRPFPRLAWSVSLLLLAGCPLAQSLLAGVFLLCGCLAAGGGGHDQRLDLALLQLVHVVQQQLVVGGLVRGQTEGC